MEALQVFTQKESEKKSDWRWLLTELLQEPYAIQHGFSRLSFVEISSFLEQVKEDGSTLSERGERVKDLCCQILLLIEDECMLEGKGETPYLNESLRQLLNRKNEARSSIVFLQFACDYQKISSELQALLSHSQFPTEIGSVIQKKIDELYTKAVSYLS